MTTPATANGVTTGKWPSLYSAGFIDRIISAIVGGSPFSRSVTTLNTDRGTIAFPTVTDIDDPAWLPELGLIPQLGIDGEPYEAALSKMAGTVLISRESIDDTDFPITAATTQVLQDTFSAKLDRDLIGGTGPAPAPTGVLSVADEVTGTDLELAAISAKAAIATAGGAASHIAMTPAQLGEVESQRDGIGRSLYPDAATTFAGLQTVIAPAASQAMVYDSARLWLCINRDFVAETSEQAAEAWNRYGVSLRIVGRFALAVPMASKAIRRLTVTGNGGSGGTEPTAATAHAAAKTSAARSKH